MMRRSLVCTCLLALVPATAPAQDAPATRRGGAAGAVATQPSTQPVTRPATQPATQPAGPVKFQPGVAIDWTHKRVLIDGEIVLREGVLELFACSPNTKEHESIVRVHARPVHILQALGLLGLEPGHPPYYSMKRKEVVPAEGQRLEILVRWTADGRTQSVPIWQWMWNRKKNAPAGPIEWVFAGSAVLEDGQLLADLDGTVITVVDFESAIMAIPASHTAANEDLWLSAYTEKIPPKGTAVTVIIEAARPQASFRIDRFGRLYQGEQPAMLRQILETAQAAVAAGTTTAIVQQEAGAPAVQVQQLAQALRHVGLTEVRVEVAAAAGSERTAVIGPDIADPQPLAVLESLADLGRQLPSAVEGLADSFRQKYEQLNERATHIGTAAAGVARALGSDDGVWPPAAPNPAAP